MEVGPYRTHEGVCDASGAVLEKAGSSRFWVANDEDTAATRLRLYDLATGGGSLAEVTLDDTWLAVDPEHREIDLEASAWMNDRIYWIGSHSRNRKGKKRVSRHRLFATEIRDGVPVAVGRPYCNLVRDASEALGLELDTGLGPKDGGLSIEGLSASSDPGELWIGLRSPLFKGQALLVMLRNAAALVEADVQPEFGEPAFLDLDGLGIRSIDYWPRRNTYLLLAGSTGSADDGFQLLRWSGPLASRPERLDGVDLNALCPDRNCSPEALMIDEESETVYLLFDEGNRTVGGEKCKDAAERSFRSVSLQGL